MKPRIIERLDLMAALREAELEADMKRHQAALRQIAYQRGVLASYESRLAESWRRGGVVTAGHAMRAERFSDASRKASGQIDQLERETRALLAEALKQLAALGARRDDLSEALRKAEASTVRESERRGERMQVWRPATAREI
jgi:hypothetical protein